MIMMYIYNTPDRVFGVAARARADTAKVHRTSSNEMQRAACIFKTREYKAQYNVREPSW